MCYGNFDALVEAINSVPKKPINRNSLMYREFYKRELSYGIPESDIPRVIDETRNTSTVVFDCAGEAIIKSQERYPNNTMNQDMFRHGYWSALLVDTIGEGYAETATTTYEDATPNNNGISRDMDIYNNSIGRQLASGKIFDSFEQLEEMIVKAINEGKFVKIVEGKLVPSLSYEQHEKTTENSVLMGSQRIYDDQDILGRVDRLKDVDCYHVSFEASGKVNFYLNPLDQDLNVDLAIYDSNDYLIDQSANGKGQHELINILVSSGLTYYIKVKHNDSSIPTGNNYHLRCKYYDNQEEYKHLIKATNCYQGNGGSRILSVYNEKELQTTKGSIADGEPVNVLRIEDETAYISYSTSNGNKEGYVPLSHLGSKDYWKVYIEKMKAKGHPGLVNNWYIYEDWTVTQYFNDSTSSSAYKGHLGLDVKNIKKPVARAVYAGKVIFAGPSKTSSGNRSANGYVVQIEHSYSDDKKFYSFYAHLRPESINVSYGDIVNAGYIIGIMGHTTTSDSGSGMGDHIHIGIYTGWVAPTGQQYGYNRVNGSAASFSAPDGYHKYMSSTFYDPTLWSAILEIQPPVVDPSDREPLGSISEFKSKYHDIIQQKAAEMNIDSAVLGAVIVVESGASGFVNDKVKIRFENHIFVRRAGHSDLFSYSSEKAWKDHKFRRSVNESWEDVHVNGQSGEYNAFDFAKSLNKKAAYESISMGLGQIMGFNHSASGYSSAEEMYDGFNIGHKSQINGMISFIKANNAMVEALQKNDYETFVTRYNGSGNVEVYTKRLKEAETTYRVS